MWQRGSHHISRVPIPYIGAYQPDTYGPNHGLDTLCTSLDVTVISGRLELDTSMPFNASTLRRLDASLDTGLDASLDASTRSHMWSASTPRNTPRR